MLTSIEHADMYAPEPLGRASVCRVGDRIARASCAGDGAGDRNVRVPNVGLRARAGMRVRSAW